MSKGTFDFVDLVESWRLFHSSSENEEIGFPEYVRRRSLFRDDVRVFLFNHPGVFVTALTAVSAFLFPIWQIFLTVQISDFESSKDEFGMLSVFNPADSDLGMLQNFTQGNIAALFVIFIIVVAFFIWRVKAAKARLERIKSAEKLRAFEKLLFTLQCAILIFSFRLVLVCAFTTQTFYFAVFPIIAVTSVHLYALIPKGWRSGKMAESKKIQLIKDVPPIVLCLLLIVFLFLVAFIPDFLPFSGRFILSAAQEKCGLKSVIEILFLFVATAYQLLWFFLPFMQYIASWYYARKQKKWASGQRKVMTIQQWQTRDAFLSFLVAVFVFVAVLYILFLLPGVALGLIALTRGLNDLLCLLLIR